MTNLEGMPSYFWLTSSRLRKPIRDEVPYTTQALRQDLTRVRTAWDECQASRDRNAIYGYLSAVFDLVIWWTAEDRAIDRARWALQLQRLDLPTTDEPFAALVNRLPRSSGGRVASTNVPRGLPVSGDAVEAKRRTVFCMRPDESAAWCVFSSFRLSAPFCIAALNERPPTSP